MPVGKKYQRLVPTDQEMLGKPGWQVHIVAQKDPGSSSGWVVSYTQYHNDGTGRGDASRTKVKERSHTNLRRSDKIDRYWDMAHSGDHALPTKQDEEDWGYIGMDPGVDPIFKDKYDFGELIRRKKEERSTWDPGKSSATTSRFAPRGIDIRARESDLRQALHHLELEPITPASEKMARRRAFEAGKWKYTGLLDNDKNMSMLRQMRHESEISVRPVHTDQEGNVAYGLYVLDTEGMAGTVTPAPILPWEKAEKDLKTGEFRVVGETPGQRLKRKASESRKSRIKDMISEEVKYMSPGKREVEGIGEEGSQAEKDYINRRISDRMQIYGGKFKKEWPLSDSEIARAIEVSGYPYEMLSERDKLIREKWMEEVQKKYRELAPEIKIPEEPEVRSKIMLEEFPATRAWFEEEGYDIEDVAKEAMERQYDPETLELIKSLRNEGYPEQYLPSAAQLKNLNFDWDTYYTKYGYLFDQVSGGDFYFRKAEEYSRRKPKIEGMREKLRELGHTENDIEVFLERPWMAEGIIRAGKNYEAPTPRFESITPPEHINPMAVAIEARGMEEERMAQAEGEPMRTYEEVIREQIHEPISFTQNVASGETTIPKEYFEGLEHWDVIEQLENLGYDREAQKALGFCQDPEICQYIISRGIKPEYISQIAEDSMSDLIAQGYSPDEADRLSSLKERPEFQEMLSEARESSIIDERVNQEDIRFEESELEDEFVETDESEVDVVSRSEEDEE